jgi:PleD family two-component response regulator
MPEMDGFELAELMRGSERTRDVPIIFITAGSRDQHRVFKGYESGAVDFLYKPIDPHGSCEQGRRLLRAASAAPRAIARRCSSSTRCSWASSGTICATRSARS